LDFMEAVVIAGSWCVRRFQRWRRQQG